MVRLKGFYDYVDRIKELMFQFHNGSIKSRHLTRDFAGNPMFQFHNGSIKSGSPVVGVGSPLSGFNSTMVRLKAGQVGTCETGQRGFNSTMVRLKEGVSPDLSARSISVSIPQWFD